MPLRDNGPKMKTWHHKETKGHFPLQLRMNFEHETRTHDGIGFLDVWPDCGGGGATFLGSASSSAAAAA